MHFLDEEKCSIHAAVNWINNIQNYYIQLSSIAQSNNEMLSYKMNYKVVMKILLQYFVIVLYICFPFCLDGLLLSLLVYSHMQYILHGVKSK